MTTAAPTLGWIGLGNMGRGMAKNLVQKGKLSNPLVIYNRTVAKAEKLVQDIGHATVSTSITDVVNKADIIFICLGDDEAVLSNIETIVRECKTLSSKLFVDCSTISPDTTTKVNEMLTSGAVGAQFIACPVFGAPAMAESGQLVCVLAGPNDQIGRVVPYCKGVMGRENIIYADAPPSRATHLKIIGNTFILNMVLALSEGHTLAEKSGLGTTELHKFIEAVFPGPYTAYSNRLLGGDYFRRDEPLFAVALARKDARHARTMAQTVDMEMKGLEIADSYLADVQGYMGEKGDIAGIYGAKRKEANLKFENDE